MPQPYYYYARGSDTYHTRLDCPVGKSIEAEDFIAGRSYPSQDVVSVCLWCVVSPRKQ